jgi:hypothetical protein
MKNEKNEHQYYECKLQIDDDLVYQARKYLPKGVNFPDDPNTKWEMPEGMEFIDEVLIITLVAGSPAITDSPTSNNVAGAVEVGLGAIRTAWSIIEKGAAIPKTANQSSAVLNKADMDWSHYANSNIFESKEMTFTLDQFLFMDVPSMCIAKARYVVDLSYGACYSGADPKVAKGQYCPNISVTVLESYNAIGTHLFMNAEISNISNINAPGQEVLPHFYLTLQFQAKKTMSSGTWTNKMTIRGDEGIANYGTPEIWIEQW